MATSTVHRRLVNPRLGTFFGIFVSLLAALVLLLLIFERLGLEAEQLRLAMFAGPLVLYVLIGVVAQTSRPLEFFASGRRVPAVYTGLVLALSAVGATGLVAGTGLFFLNGFDAWCIAMGIWSGFVVMALMVAPYIRKFGAFTVPSYLGRRFESQLLRLTAAGILFVPMLLIAAGELKIGVFAASWLTGMSQPAVALVIVVVIVVSVSLGGMRSLTWSNVAQAIAALLALMVPVAIVAAIETSLPLPQLSHGPVLRAIGRQEASLGVPIPIAAAFALDFAGTGIETITHRIAQPYANVGPIAFILTSLCVMCGIAGAPWLLPRCSCTPGVYEARKSTAWAIVFVGLALITAASVAVFLRDIVMDTLVGRPVDGLPAWFERLRQLGHASVEGNLSALPLTSFGFRRDATLFALPIAADFSDVVLYMALAGAVGAALLGASAAVVAIGNMLAEDGVNGLAWEPLESRIRLTLARIGISGAAVLAGWICLVVPADPLDLMLWALTLSASAAFPVLALSIWWKRLSAGGALAGMIAGFVVALLAILAGEATWLGIPGQIGAVFGLPASLMAAVIGTRVTPAVGRGVQQIVRDMRMPGGETMHDREVRIRRLKRRRVG
ncbi:MAG: cation acetate symporter [Hyphomicrobiaceae bacterium]